MANQTVYPYGTGGQLPSGIAIVNDLTTGGADKALSAEQGKVLNEIIFGDPTQHSGTFTNWTLYAQSGNTPNRYYKIGNEKTYTGGVIVFKLTNYSTYKIGVVIQDGTAYLSTAISDTGWQTADITKTVASNEAGYNIRVTIARQDNTNMSAGEFLSVIDEISYDFYKGESGIEERIENLEDTEVYKPQRIPMKVIGTDKYVGKVIELSGHSYTYENIGTLSTTGTSNQGRQGAAVFGDYLFQCHNTNNAVVVFKLSTGQSLQTIALTANANNHANTAGFSGQYYDANDDFPCLYVSSEGESKVYLYRITGTEGSFVMTLVQTISFSVPYYFPNMHIDAPNNRGVVVGYKENSWQSPDGNAMMCCCFDLPDVTDGDATLENSYGEFSFPFIYATQGALARYGKLYHSFGNTNYGLYIGGIIVIDYILKNVESFIDLKAVGNIEPEGLGISEGGFIVTTQEKSVLKITP